MIVAFYQLLYWEMNQKLDHCHQAFVTHHTVFVLQLMPALYIQYVFLYIYNWFIIVAEQNIVK